jgi:hypothetical protein
MLVILAVLGTAVIAFAVAAAAGWVRLSHVDPFTRIQVAPATQPSADVMTAEAAIPTAAVEQPATVPAADVPPEPAFTDRTIVLRPADARLVGRGTQVTTFETRAHGRNGNTLTHAVITGWAREGGAAEWTVRVPQAGRYTVTLDYAAGERGRDGRAAGSFVLTAGDAKLAGEFGTTRSARAFELVDVGTLDLPAGEVRVTFTPDPPGRGRESPLNLRGVRLFPTD